MFPVIEVNAGRGLDVVLSSEATVKLPAMSAAVAAP